ncbi:MAG: radical SAM protein [Thermoplasmata archaeon]|nr:MAG: radical SAM protein [Thermoplasmata archaeon]
MTRPNVIREISRMPEIRQLPLRFRLYILRSFVGFRRTNTLRMKDDKAGLSAYLPMYPSRAFTRFVNAQVAASKGEAGVEIVNFAVTHRCGQDCWHCISPPKEADDLDAKTILTAISELEDLGAYSFLLTGGDPLMREDIFGIVGGMDDRAVINISTPGNLLDAACARRLKKAGLQAVFIGLDHCEEERNDELRGQKTAFQASLSAVKNARKAGLLVALSTVATQERIESGEIFRFLDFAKHHDVDDVAIFEPIPVGKIARKNEHMLHKDQREKIKYMHTYANKKENYPRVIAGPYMDSRDFMGCTAGFNRLYVDAEGLVYPCDVLPFSYGSIKEESIKEIWGRMHGDFQRPRSSCLMLDNCDVMADVKDRPADSAKCREICGDWREGEVPMFYKRLGVK